MASSSQAWLAGADNSLDNFFRSGPSTSRMALKVKAAAPSTASGRDSITSDGSRRSPASRLKFKRVALEERSSAVGGSPTKKSRLSGSGRVKANGSSHTEDAPWNKEIASPSRGSRVRIGGEGRRALGDVTRTLQNSPHRRRTATLRPSSKLKNGKSLHGGHAGIEDEEPPSDAELIDNYVPPRPRVACLAQTPHDPLKKAAKDAKESLPTPPSSSLPVNRVLFWHQHDSPAPKELALQRKGSDSKKTIAQTPSTLSEVVKKSYPTPSSIAVPRFKFPPKSAKNSPPFPVPNFHPDSDGLALTSPTSSPPDCPQSDDHFEKENENPRVSNVDTSKHKDKVDCKSGKEYRSDLKKGKTKDQDKIYTVIPSSQTQYIHYSPTKQRIYDVSLQMSTPRRKLFESSIVIPCSQPLTTSPSSSQVGCLSSRKTRRPEPIITPKGTGATLNFVVPTSQEDEQEICISEDDASTASWAHQILKECEAGPGDDTQLRPKDNGNPDHTHETLQPEGETKFANSTTESKQSASNPDQTAQYRILDRMFDDLQRLAEKAEKGIVTPSQVLSRPRDSLDSLGRRTDELDRNFKKGENDEGVQDESDWDVETRNRLITQSSITEPDESQYDEDPFSMTNAAYAQHIRLNRNTTSQSRSLSKGSVVERSNLGRSSDSSAVVSTSSDTQPDEDDEDPFPNLPPLPPLPSATAPPSTSTPTSTIDKTAVETLLRTKSRGNPVREQSSQTELESDSETESESETQCDSQEELFPSLPPSTRDAGLWNSPIDEDVDEDVDEGETISTQDVRRILGMDDNTNADTDTALLRHDVSRFRGRDGHGTDEEESMGESEEDGETIPTAVREFLSMFPRSQG